MADDAGLRRAARLRELVDKDVGERIIRPGERHPK